jgi:type I restriction enzyme, S subunit
MLDDLTELPEKWGLTTFSEIAERIQNALKAGPFGSSLKKTFYVNHGYKIYGQEQVINEDPFCGDYYIDEERYQQLKSCVVKPGDILISLVGTIGKVLILPENAEPGIINPRLVKLSLDKQLVSNEFIKKYLESPHVKDHLVKLSHGGTMDILNLSILKTLPIPLPPLNEQKRIVAKIEELRSHTQAARNTIAHIPKLLEQFRQSVLAAAFRGDLTAEWRSENPDVEPAEVLLERIRKERRDRWESTELEKMRSAGKMPKDGKWRTKYKEPDAINDSELPELPKNWCYVKWSEIGFCQNGRAFPSSEYTDTGFRLLRPGNLHVSGKLVWTDSNTRYLPDNWAIKYPDFIVESNQLVINLTAQSLADEFLGRVCLSGNEKSLLNQRIARLTPIGISSRFCLWLLKSSLFRNHVDKHNTGSLIQHMFTSQIDEFIFALPSLLEQQLVIEIVEQKLAAIDRIEQQYQFIKTELDRLDRSILAKAFKGELVPQDPTDEAAIVLLERIRNDRASQAKPAKTKRKKA